MFVFNFPKIIFFFFFLANSITSSQQSPYIWDQSIEPDNQKSQSIESDNQKSQSIDEYNGRMISQSTISNDDQLKSKYISVRHGSNLS